MKNHKIVFLLALWMVAGLARGAVTGFTFTTLASFNDTNNGANPYAPPVFGADGRLYGVLPYGGSLSNGVIFAVTTNGVQTNLHVFASSEGATPVGPLVSAPDGTLYGTTGAGSTNGDGTIFKVTTNGEFTLLHTFGAVTNAAGSSLDGSGSYGGVIQGRDGLLYGMTYAGGVSNKGTVFQLSLNGAFTTLHSFTGTNGAYPYTASLVEGADGLFYGTTSDGGIRTNGTIFQITASGDVTTLFRFAATNGSEPYAGLSLGSDGCLYGTTVYGGTHGVGTAFRITTNGVLKTLYHFGGTDGLAYPEGGLTPGFKDALYGTTYSGGTQGYGALFQLLTNGALTILYSFTNGDDGARPYAGVILDTTGNVYGTTLYGGKSGGYGAVYRWSDPTRPTNTIILPTTGQRWSNIVFTAKGQPTDNVRVSGAFYSINGSAWQGATTTNKWTNWIAQVTLIPGTNLLQSYAMDYSGNLSLTSSVSFDFVVTNQLKVRTFGMGAIKPNYSNAWLEIGRNYSITSAPATGFGFANWTISTNWIGGTTVTGTNLQFMMQSNLTLQANFLDLAGPTVTFTAPTAGQKMTNALATVTGKASDNVGVTNVWFQLNQGDWSFAASTNSFTNWNTPLLTLTAGMNTVSAYARDFVGNFSTTSSVSFVSTNTFKLQMNFGTAQPLTSTGLLFSLQLSPSLSGQIQYSTNLSTWLVLTNFGGTNTTLNFRDVAATNSSQRFYRAVIP